MITTFSKVQSFENKTAESINTINLRSYLLQRRSYFIFKRLFDITVSFFVITIVLSWMVPLIALLIKLDSSGPVFFIQRRVGRWGRSFRCFKFRTMVVNDLANSKQAIENDRRITKLGGFLRRSNLDEFPQFINVLLGEMSIVGPRPHMHSDCNMFSSVVNNYKFRTAVMPGITGLAQVKGYRGPTKSFKDVFHRYQFDAFYVRNANFWLDLRIIRKTAGQTVMTIFAKVFSKQQLEKAPLDTVTNAWSASFKGMN